MKVGDLIIVKDCHGYNAFMQNLMGHIGIVIETNPKVGMVLVSIQDRRLFLDPDDLKILNESRT